MSDEFDMLEIEGIEAERETEKKRFEDFAAKALRLPRKGSFEIMLCQHLMAAVSADPMQKVRLVCEAAYMVPKDKLTLDMEQINIIYQVCLSFLNVFKNDVSCRISWSFAATEENYEKYVKPWHDPSLPLSFCYGAGVEIENKRKMLERCKTDAEEFWLLTIKLDLHLSSLQVLKAEFLSWSIPKVMEIYEKLSRLVDPDLYKELLMSLKPKESV